ncbi:MAG TPA: carbohydrate ABC transporter permease [Propionibacteriaceae bacterium]|jgi:ABC-type glycerol-3-phosphate transport system permease component|nr:carbohydrate ABC transporter permease [Propionibacteriaceae bacterium]
MSDLQETSAIAALNAVSPRASSPTTTPRRRRPPSITQIGLYGLLVSAAIIALFPVVWLLSGSLQSPAELYGGQHFLPASPQWRNYLDAWIKGDLGIYLANSVFYTAAALIGILMISSLAGYALARLTFRGKGVFTFLILAVMIIPAPAMFIAQYKLLISFGLTDNRLGYILILITAGIPMATLIMRSFFAGQPKELEEAAAIDGASTLRTFLSVILPLARPGLAAVAVIQGLAAWNEYLMALVLFERDELMPIQRGLTSFMSSETPQQHILLAATTISVIPVIIFYLFAQRQIIQGIGAGALK